MEDRGGERLLPTSVWGAWETQTRTSVTERLRGWGGRVAPRGQVPATARPSLPVNAPGRQQRLAPAPTWDTWMETWAPGFRQAQS